MNNRAQKKTKVFVMLSGGVDSSVAALLLKKSGKYEVHGCHLICWRDDCSQFQKEAVYAMLVAKKLGIKFHLIDLEKEYKEKVFNYMISEYSAGRTPNPDAMCNREIKFGVFLEKALTMGADYVATGHYVKIQNAKVKSQNDKSKFKIVYKMLEAEDRNKDQSYFLWTLTQNQLKRCLFPVGDLTKEEVRALAKKYDLPTAEKKDSQGLCFVGKINFQDFLQKYIEARPGQILNPNKEEIGVHEGAQFYTIGQRQGFGIANTKPQYVAKRDIATNTIVLAEDKNNSLLYREEIGVENFNWISGKSPKMPCNCSARIRYRQQLAPCAILMSSDDIRIRFVEPQWAVAPGQSVVFYKNGEMLGGGIIKS